MMFKVLAFLISVSAAAMVTNTQAAEIKPLEKNTGYLVLDLDLGQKVTEISFARISRKGADPVKFGPYEKGRHLLLFSLPKGNYRLVRVAAPFYDLPFLHDYSNQDRLLFTIEPGSTNYFAQIHVADFRSSYGVSIGIRNRLGFTYRELEKKHGEIVANHPIRYAGLLEDNFYNEFLRPGKQEKND